MRLKNDIELLRVERVSLNWARGMVFGPFFDYTWNTCGCKRWWVGSLYLELRC